MIMSGKVLLLLVVFLSSHLVTGLPPDRGDRVKRQEYDTPAEYVASLNKDYEDLSGDDELLTNLEEDNSEAVDVESLKDDESSSSGDFEVPSGNEETEISENDSLEASDSLGSGEIGNSEDTSRQSSTQQDEKEGSSSDEDQNLYENLEENEGSGLEKDVAEGSGNYSENSEELAAEQEIIRSVESGEVLEDTSNGSGMGAEDVIFEGSELESKNLVESRTDEEDTVLEESGNDKEDTVTEGSGNDEEVTASEGSGYDEEDTVTEGSGNDEEDTVSEGSANDEEDTVSEESGNDEEDTVTEGSGNDEEDTVSEESGNDEEDTVTEGSGNDEEDTVSEESGNYEKDVLLEGSALNTSGNGDGFTEEEEDDDLEKNNEEESLYSPFSYSEVGEDYSHMSENATEWKNETLAIVDADSIFDKESGSDQEISEEEISSGQDTLNVNPEEEATSTGTSNIAESNTASENNSSLHEEDIDAYASETLEEIQNLQDFNITANDSVSPENMGTDDVEYIFAPDTTLSNDTEYSNDVDFEDTILSENNSSLNDSDQHLYEDTQMVTYDEVEDMDGLFDQDVIFNTTEVEETEGNSSIILDAIDTSEELENETLVEVDDLPHEERIQLFDNETTLDIEEEQEVREEILFPDQAYELESGNQTDVDEGDGENSEEREEFVPITHEGWECSNTTFGCCPGDEDLPAHGKNREGCCLKSKFGCCPDNLRPAQGPLNQGCECTTSKFGCCPNGLMAARGENNEGCGCRFSTHGCCPDQYTQAAGPNNEGCDCKTYEYGCCPDGRTIAQGPNLEGCEGCEATEHGCCPDNFTPAEGPYNLGCGCAGSEFGCCPDGVSEALDPLGEDFANMTDLSEGDLEDIEFAGCGEIPGEACHLKKDPGTCKENFTVKWFFDKEYGGCSRFWWSSCGGNANRFDSLESCERMCVTPKGSGRCYLPKVEGPCKGSYKKWYFDLEWNKCISFKYGGCMGNGNRFEKQVECQETCHRSNTEDLDVCSQPMEPGPCRGIYLRYFYDQDTGDCKAFNYTGCKGNKNRFSSLERCENTCQHKAVLAKAKLNCNKPKMVGICNETLARWYFNQKEKTCQPFYYSGCGGNENRFESVEECESSCPNTFPPEVGIKAKIVVVEENERATLKVNVEANPPPSITWEFENEKINASLDESGSRFSLQIDGSLKIHPALQNDSGVYTVIADNGLGQVTRNQITLKVHPSKMPLEVKISKERTEFESGEEISIYCSVRGYPIPIIRWYKNNTPLSKRDRVSVSEDSKTLVIRDSSLIDRGIYSCRATNKFESIFDTIDVVVKQAETVKECVDKPEYANCKLIVQANFCTINEYYADFCCKSCTEAGQIPPL